MLQARVHFWALLFYLCQAAINQQTAIHGQNLDGQEENKKARYFNSWYLKSS